MSSSPDILGIENSHLFQSILLQAFETTYLIENSNAPDTVVGRCQLLKSIFEAILSLRESPRFSIELQEALDNYKQIYYDKIISDKQAHIIIKADWKYLINYFFQNIIRSFYNYIDKQFDEIHILKKEETKRKRISSLHDFLVSQNPEILKLVYLKSDKEALDDSFTKVGKLQQYLYNYINLKQDGFNEWVLVEFNGVEYEDDNEAPISEVARKMIKEIKSKLYLLQFELRNQPYIIKLIVTGAINVGLSIDEKMDKAMLEKVKSLFSKSETSFYF